MWELGLDQPFCASSASGLAASLGGFRGAGGDFLATSSCSDPGGDTVCWSALSRAAGDVVVSGDSIFWEVGGEFCEGGVDFLGGGGPGCFLGLPSGLDGAVILREREGGGMESPNIGCTLTTVISGFVSLQGKGGERVVSMWSSWGSESWRASMCSEYVEGVWREVHGGGVCVELMGGVSVWRVSVWRGSVCGAHGGGGGGGGEGH